jgi:hypothetical protein
MIEAIAVALEVVLLDMVVRWAATADAKFASCRAAVE